MKYKRSLPACAALALLVFHSAGCAEPTGSTAPLSGRRTFTFTYDATVQKIPAGARRVRIWVPVPASDEHQKISDLKIVSPVRHRMTRETIFGNTLAYFEPDAIPASGEIPISLSFHVARTEDCGVAQPITAKEKTLFLRDDLLAPAHGPKVEQVLKIAAVKPGTPGVSARSIYDYVLAHMTYDKSGTGWGRGDFAYACDAGKGNCTDFHALFISLMRASAIPARFEIGFPLPVDRGEGEVKGYHCWAFFHDGTSWIPVDASEASKAPEFAPYYFGHLGTNRVRFTIGRDLTLEPRQDGPPLNYLVYPYVEVDGKPHDAVARKFGFKDLH